MILVLHNLDMQKKFKRPLDSEDLVACGRSFLPFFTSLIGEVGVTMFPPLLTIADMYDNLGANQVGPRPPTNLQSNPLGNAFYGAGSGLIRGGLGAYGERILGSSSEYVQSNVSNMFNAS